MRLTRIFGAIASLILTSCTAAAFSPAPIGSFVADTVEARALFESNIDAIHKHDRSKYLGTYVHSPGLGRNGPAGLELGYDNWSARRDSSWPDTLIARRLRVLPIAPGVVFGTYCYTFTQRDTTTSGVSERIFVKTPDGWKIAVTTAFGHPAGGVGQCR